MYDAEVLREVGDDEADAEAQGEGCGEPVVPLQCSESPIRLRLWRGAGNVAMDVVGVPREGVTGAKGLAVNGGRAGKMLGLTGVHTSSMVVNKREEDACSEARALYVIQPG